MKELDRKNKYKLGEGLMNRKIIFLDIDGTIINEYSTIPESAQEAIKRARENGHYVFLCTGRASSEIVGEVAKLEIDGKICAAGGYVEVGGKVIREKYMSVIDVAYIVEFMKKNEISYCLESPAGAFVCGRIKAYFRKIIERKIAKWPDKKEKIETELQVFMNQMIEDAEMIRADVNKVTFYDAPLSIDALKEAFESRFVLLPNSMQTGERSSGELMLPGVHKASGIEAVLKHLNIDKADSFAFGDGLNDMEMLQFVACGIAMGNACDALKEVAMDVTGNVNEDGLYEGFKKYHLI